MDGGAGRHDCRYVRCDVADDDGRPERRDKANGNDRVFRVLAALRGDQHVAGSGYVGMTVDRHLGNRTGRDIAAVEAIERRSDHFGDRRQIARN